MARARRALDDPPYDSVIRPKTDPERTSLNGIRKLLLHDHYLALSIEKKAREEQWGESAMWTHIIRTYENSKILWSQDTHICVCNAPIDRINNSCQKSQLLNVRKRYAALQLCGGIDEKYELIPVYSRRLNISPWHGSIRWLKSLYLVLRDSRHIEARRPIPWSNADVMLDTEYA